MRWEVNTKIPFDFVAFAGLNLSGERRVIEFHTVGGRQGDLAPEDLKSCAIVGPVGLRVAFLTTDDPDTWTKGSWRCVKITKDAHFKTKEGRPCVRVPDLDFLDAFDARRTDPDLQCSFEEAKDLDAAGWTFGHAGKVALKSHVKVIRIDYFPPS